MVLASEMLQKSNKGTWHGPCFGIVSVSGLPESENYKKPRYTSITGMYYLLFDMVIFTNPYLAR